MSGGRPGPGRLAGAMTSRASWWYVRPVPHPDDRATVTVQHLRLAAGEETVAPRSTHRVLLHTGPAHRLWEARGGHTRQSAHRRGDVVVVAAGESTWMRWDRTTSFLSLSLPTSFVAGVAETLDLDPDRLVIAGSFSEQDPQVEHIGLALLHETEAGSPHGRLYSDSLATALSVHLIGRRRDVGAALAAKPSGIAPPALRRVTDYVAAHLANTISLAELAAVASLSPFHFARQFRKTTGLSPHQYVLRARVEEARRLLLEGRAGVAEIAAEVGFCSQSHLSRHMRQTLGVTPAAVRRRTARG